MSTTAPEKVNRCPECKSTDLMQDYDVGELSCRNCGLVVRDGMVSEEPEWRAYTKEETASRGRVGTPTSFAIHDKGLSTVIDRVGRDAFGHQLPLATRLEMIRLKKWQVRTRIYTSKDRNLAQAMTELDRLADVLHVSQQVKERAAIIYRKALEKGLVRGRTIASVAAAALYAGCRLSETQRTLKVIATASQKRLTPVIRKNSKLARQPVDADFEKKKLASAKRTHRKDVARCYRLLVTELDLRMPVEDSAKCVSKIATKIQASTEIQIPMRVQQHAMQIIAEAKRNGVAVGKDPMGLAASALYIACVLSGDKEIARTTQKQIAENADVTEVTIRNRYKDLKETLNLNMIPALP